YIAVIIGNQRCLSVKSNKSQKNHYGLYINMVPLEGGLFNQFLLLDSSNRAYYLFDSIDYCAIGKSKLIENFRQQGDFHVYGDSIKFSFDSCASITSHATLYIHGQNIEINQKQFDHDTRQEYRGKFDGDQISFVITNVNAKHGNSFRKENYIRCGAAR
ncbi:MAG TPA: hypothetical protein VFU15_04595, partial [Bacteroidia bacterium]|nr:hypothetical protein [Bacteroidia bacterium]